MRRRRWERKTGLVTEPYRKVVNLKWWVVSEVIVEWPKRQWLSGGESKISLGTTNDYREWFDIWDPSISRLFRTSVNISTREIATGRVSLESFEKTFSYEQMQIERLSKLNYRKGNYFMYTR